MHALSLGSDEKKRQRGRGACRANDRTGDEVPARESEGEGDLSVPSEEGVSLDSEEMKQPSPCSPSLALEPAVEARDDPQPSRSDSIEETDTPRGREARRTGRCKEAEER